MFKIINMFKKNKVRNITLDNTNAAKMLRLVELNSNLNENSVAEYVSFCIQEGIIRKIDSNIVVNVGVLVNLLDGLVNTTNPEYVRYGGEKLKEVFNTSESPEDTWAKFKKEWHKKVVPLLSLFKGMYIPFNKDVYKIMEKHGYPKHWGNIDASRVVEEAEGQLVNA